jgi:hypothetical protein
MSRTLIIGCIAAAGILGCGMWASSQIEQLQPMPDPRVAFAEQQVTTLETTAKQNGIKLGKSHAQLVAEEVAQNEEFRRRMSDIKRMGDQVEAIEAQQVQAKHDRQCAAGLESAC